MENELFSVKKKISKMGFRARNYLDRSFPAKKIKSQCPMTSFHKKHSKFSQRTFPTVSYLL